MKRSKWKLNFLTQFELIKNERNNFGLGSSIIKKRAWRVNVEDIGQKVLILNGQRLISSFVDTGKLGYFFGEFCLTRKHGETKSKKKKSGKKGKKK